MKVRAGNMRRSAQAVAIACMFAAGTAAAGQDDRWYVQGSLASAVSDSVGGVGVAGRVNAGWRFTDHFAAEFGYARPVAGSGGNQVVDGGELAVRGELPVSAKLSAFGRVGVFKWDEQGAFSDDGTDLTTGVGVRYAVNDAMSLTGSLDYYDGVGQYYDEGTQQVNVGLQLDF